MKNIHILIPVYNDWGSLEQLLKKISDLNFEDKYEINIVLVDDGSNEQHNLENLNSKFFNSLYVVELYRNLGHQRAITIGLSYIEDNFDADSVIVMDSDGEDKPEDIISLIRAQETNPCKIIFSKRKKRYEGFFFRLFYSIYKLLFHLLTVEKIQFGTFSIIPKILLTKIVSVSEIWNHYSSVITNINIHDFSDSQ